MPVEVKDVFITNEEGLKRTETDDLNDNQISYNPIIELKINV